MNCRKTEYFLPAYIMRELNDEPALFIEIEAHLQKCKKCNIAYEEFILTIDFLKENKDIFAEAFQEADRKEAQKSKKKKTKFYFINQDRTRRPNFIANINAAAACLFVCLIGWVIFSCLTKSQVFPEKHSSEHFTKAIQPSVQIEDISDGDKVLLASSRDIITTDHFKTLLINEKHRLIMNENTSLTIESLVSNENIGCILTLASGRIYTHVEHDGNPFVVETTNGQAIITGTTFDIEANESKMKLIVTEGTVNFKSPQGSVNVSSGHFSEISSKSMPTQPGLCDAKHLTAWATGYELKSALEKIESITDSVDISDLWLTANSGPIDLDEIHYETWIEQKRDWFEKEFPSIFKLQDILLLEGTLAPYQELLFTSGIVWDFKYSHVTNRQFSFITPDSLMRIASSYDVDKNLLLKNMPSIKEQKGIFSGGEAYQKLIGQFELAQKSKESLDSDLLLYSLLASTYLANTRTLIWLYIANESTELTSKDKAELLSLLQSEVNETGKIKEYMIRLFTISKNCSCEEFSVLIDKVIDSLVEIKEIEEKITELKTR